MINCRCGGARLPACVPTVYVDYCRPVEVCKARRGNETRRDSRRLRRQAVTRCRDLISSTVGKLN